MGLRGIVGAYVRKGGRFGRVLGTCIAYVRDLPIRLWTAAVHAGLFMLWPVFRVRLCDVHTVRIGHMVSTTDLALLRLADAQDTRNVFVMPRGTCNEQLRKMYERTLDARSDVRLLDARTSVLARALLPAARRLSYLVQSGQSKGRLYCGSPDATGLDAWGNRPSGRPLLRFTDEETQAGWKALAKWGIDPTSRYVCLHVRDSAYLAASDVTRDWAYHDYRNPPLRSYVPLVEYLVAEGYFVLRMGKIANGPFPIQGERIVDYPFSSEKSDFLDVFAYAQCTFAVAGAASGVDQLACAFNRPHLVTNWVPFDDPRNAADKVMFIPALLSSSRDGVTLPLSEMMGHRYGSSARYDAAGIGVMHNSASEILTAVEEFMDWIEADTQEPFESDPRQTAFWAWAVECGLDAPLSKLAPQHGFHRARMGASFLEQHQDVLMT